MSVIGSLTQISPQLLKRIKEMPSVLDIFFQTAPATDEEPELESLDNLLPERIELLHEILPDSIKAAERWTFNDLNVLARYKINHPNDYSYVLLDLAQILEAGKDRKCLDIGNYWQVVSFLFRGDESDEFLSLIASDEEGDWRINPILCGSLVQNRIGVHYLTSREVQMMANALEQFPQALVRQRFEQILSKKPHIYPSRIWDEQHYEHLLDICSDVKDFYCDAANRENAMLVKIG